MDKEKQTSKEERGDTSRENLIVPEEIFAPTYEDELDETAESESDTDIFEGSDESEQTAEGQISFFADEEADDFKEDAENDEKESIMAKFEENDERGFDPKEPRLIDKIFDFVELFAFTIATVFILTTLIFRHAIVDGPSMDKTLAHGEHLIISDLFYEPERGDIVVFEDYSLDNERLRKPIVKRVIAVAGDTVKIDTNTGKVYVNGALVDESGYVYLSANRYLTLSDHKYAIDEEYTVPKGHVFVLGDNRNNSSDSRSFGAVGVETILGEVKFRIFPFGKFGGID